LAASHCLVVQVSTCVAVDDVDETGADAAGAGLVEGGDAEVWATAALKLMSAVRIPAVRQNRTRDIGAFSLK
jgi:hypothetical protein